MFFCRMLSVTVVEKFRLAPPENAVSAHWGLCCSQLSSCPTRAFLSGWGLDFDSTHCKTCHIFVLRHSAAALLGWLGSLFFETGNKNLTLSYFGAERRSRSTQKRPSSPGFVMCFLFFFFKVTLSRGNPSKQDKLDQSFTKCPVMNFNILPDNRGLHSLRCDPSQTDGLEELPTSLRLLLMSFLHGIVLTHTLMLQTYRAAEISAWWSKVWLLNDTRWSICPNM